jgi:hypothetical protein
LGWAVQFGGELWSGGRDIAVDAAGHVHVVGYFTGTADFDPGPGVFELTGGGPQSGDVFVAKLDGAANLIWAVALGGPEIQNPKALTVDVSGNVYVVGEFAGAMDADPGPGVFNLASAGDLDGFVVKLDSDGALAWAGRIGGTSTDRTQSVAVDDTGRVYVTGEFRSTSDLDPGPGVYNLTSAGWTDAFVAKLNPSGDLVWAGRMGGGNWDRGYGIDLDDAGNVYTTGYFRTTADFDPGPGVYAMTTVGGYWQDPFVSKLTNDGDFVWARSMGGPENGEWGNRILVGDEGDLYIAGRFVGTGDFDPGPGVHLLTGAGDRDIFVTRLTRNGALVWARAMGGTDTDWPIDLALDGAGNVYTTGGFLGVADFDPGPGVHDLTSAGGADVFVSILDGDGDFAWAWRVGSTVPGGDAGNGIAVDGAFNIYSTGSFGGRADPTADDFDPGPGVLELTAIDASDAYLWKLIQQDVIPPQVTITTPAEGAIYGHDEVVAADYTCGAGLGGAPITFCVGDVPDGDLIDTATVGDHGFAVTATDTEGNRTTVTHSYRVAPWCHGEMALIFGTTGDDTLIGTSDPDVIHGLAGDDTIRGMAGDDLICGGDDDDTLYGNGGNDTLHGERGEDTLYGAGGADVLHGGGARDILRGQGGADILYGGLSRDLLIGGNGNDQLHGGAAADDLRGNTGNDTLYGDGGTDTLTGGPGRDDLDGGPGTDTCHSGEANTNCET